MIVRRSKSSAILPLRKHLIEKSLQEISAAAGKKSMDEDQFYYQQKQLLREPLLIRPIEEVMEEDARPSESMDVDDDRQQLQQLQLQQQQQHQQRLAHSFTARLGPSGLSPLVLSEVGISNDYVSRLLPQQPLDLIVMASNGSGGTSERTGLGYDPAMLRHHCTCQSDAFHPENPLRLATIWDRLVSSGLIEACVRVARKATLEEIQSCHSETHTLIYGTDMVNRCSLAGQDPPTSDGKTAKFCQLECGGVGVDADTYWNELETPAALRTAVGTLVELSHKVREIAKCG
jgi:histone deacetylase 4/5